MDGIFTLGRGLAIHRAVHRGAAKDMALVLGEIAVYAHRYAIDGDRAVGLEPIRLLVRLFALHQFLHEHHVGHHVGARVLFEGVVGQAQGSQELEVFRQVITGLGVGGVEKAVGHNHSHDATGPQMGGRLGYDVVVDFHARDGLVDTGANALGAEGRVANGDVERPLGEGHVLEAPTRMNFGRRIEEACHLAGQRINLGRVPLGRGTGHHRLQADEVTGADGRFKGAATFEAEMLHGLPHRTHHAARGVMRVQGAFARPRIFVFGQRRLEELIGAAPLAFVLGVLGVKGGFEAAPADITRQHGLFELGGMAVVGDELLDEGDRCNVSSQLFAVRALTQLEVRRDREVAGVVALQAFWVTLWFCGHFVARNGPATSDQTCSGCCPGHATALISASARSASASASVFRNAGSCARNTFGLAFFHSSRNICASCSLFIGRLHYCWPDRSSFRGVGRAYRRKRGLRPIHHVAQIAHEVSVHQLLGFERDPGCGHATSQGGGKLHQVHASAAKGADCIDEMGLRPRINFRVKERI